jgi:uncharacterized membrane protein YiaA
MWRICARQALLVEVEQCFGFRRHGQAFIEISSSAQLNGIVAQVFGLYLHVACKISLCECGVYFGNVVLALVSKGWRSAQGQYKCNSSDGADHDSFIPVLMMRQPMAANCDLSLLFETEWKAGLHGW